MRPIDAQPDMHQITWCMSEIPSSQLICEMAQAIAKGQAVFFVGAGLSAMAGAPTWDQLIQPLQARLTPPTTETSPLLLAQFFTNQFSRNELLAHMQRQIAATQLKPTKAHAVLCSLPVSVFVTTNYDNLLEAELQVQGRSPQVIRDEKNLPLWDESTTTQVLKIHGDLSAVESVVLTDSDYVRFISDKSLMKRKLAELFCYRTVIFIGYSLRDPNVSYVFNSISHELGSLKRPAYILTFDADHHQQMEWRRRGIRPLSLDTRNSADNAEKTQLLTALLLELQREVTATNRSILIVDDEEKIVRLWKRALTEAIPGAQVNGVLDGHAAMYAIGRIRPRLIIVDVNMPKMNGWELIKMVRQFPELEETRIMVSSGAGHAVSPELLQELRIQQYLPKPIALDALVTRAHELLEIPSSFVPVPHPDFRFPTPHTLLPPANQPTEVVDAPA